MRLKLRNETFYLRRLFVKRERNAPPLPWDKDILFANVDCFCGASRTSPPTRLDEDFLFAK